MENSQPRSNPSRRARPFRLSSSDDSQDSDWNPLSLRFYNSDEGDSDTNEEIDDADTSSSSEGEEQTSQRRRIRVHSSDENNEPAPQRPRLAIRSDSETLTPPHEEGSTDLLSDSVPTKVPNVQHNQQCMSFNETNQVLPSSTPFTGRQHLSLDDSAAIARMMSDTINNSTLKVAASIVQPCMPLEGKEVTISEWESWKKRFESWCKANQILDSETQQLHFNMMAGPYIDKILETAPDTSSEAVHYARTVEVLDGVFKGRTNNFSLLNSFRNTRQGKNEKNVDYVERVMRAALLIFERKDQSINKEILLVVATHAENIKLQTYSMMPEATDNPKYESLMDYARILDNQIELRRLKQAEERSQHCAILATEQPYVPRNQYSGGLPSQVGSKRHLERTQSTSQRYRRDPASRPDGCFRCGNKDHFGYQCSRYERVVCTYCQKQGHIEEVCRSKARQLETKPVNSKQQSENIANTQSYSSKLEVDNADPKQDTIDKSKPARSLKWSDLTEEAQKPYSELVAQELMFSDKSIDNLFGTIDSHDGIVYVTVAGTKINCLIDSGASVNAVTCNTFNTLLSLKANIYDVEYDPTAEIRAFASCKPLSIKARFFAKTSIAFGIKDSDVIERMEEFYVIDNARRCLLSRATSQAHQVLALGHEARKLLILRLQDKTSSKEPCGMVELNMTGNDLEKFEAFEMDPVKLKIRPNIQPTKIRYTNIPLNMREDANAQLESLVNQGVIERVSKYSDIKWISSIIPVIKSNGKLRLVVDLRGPNKAIIRESYRMPTLEFVVSRLTDCKVFSTIDLENAFYHIKLDKDSRYLTTFWSGEEYFQFNRLPFGLVNAPDIFQRALQDIVLKDCSNTLNYLDDILIYSRTEEEHDEVLSKAMKCLSDHNVKLNIPKCEFKKPSVVFLGFNLSGKGLAIKEDKIKTFLSLRHPESVSEVKSYLGLLTFFERFIPNRADKTLHLRTIANSSEFVWTKEAEEEFSNIKSSELTKIANLSFYNKEWRTELIVDASAVGLGAILVQYDKDDNLNIVCCASKSLTPVEKRYPQQHREALAVVWGVERFKYYLLGIHFVVRTDNRANEFIFGEDALEDGKRAINRSHLFALKLQPFNFTIKRIAGKDNAADALSRLIDKAQVDPEVNTEPADIFSLSSSWSPLETDEIAKESKSDDLFASIVHALETGMWQGPALALRGSRVDFQLWGNILYFTKRFYIPRKLRLKALELSHIGHPGTSSMKRLLRNHVWWPGMTVDADSYHASCRSCALTSRNITVPPLSPRELPKKPLDILHVDFLELTGLPKLLVATDGYSRYLWVLVMNSTTTEATNTALMSIFNMFGKPRLIQSDGGPQFISSSFAEFWRKEGVNCRITIPYASHTNGLVERHNGPISHAVRTAMIDKGSWKKALSDYVRAYNTRPHSSTGFSPFRLLQGRVYHDYLPVFDNWDGTYIQPPPRSAVQVNDIKAKNRQKKYYDERTRARNIDIKEGDWVLLRNTNRVNKLETKYLVDRFKVMRLHGVKAIIRAENGRDYIRWVGHLRKDVSEPPEMETEGQDIDQEVLSKLLRSQLKVAPAADEMQHQETFPNQAPVEQNDDDNHSIAPPVSSHMSLRCRKKISIPARYLNHVHFLID